MLQFWTAQFRYPGPYRMDITYATKDRLGKLFAPTKEMVQKYKYGKTSENIRREKYIDEYHTLMGQRIVSMHNLWLEIMALDYLVLTCYCNATEFCHRHISKLYLIDRGATYIGEITDFSPWQKHPDITSFDGEHAWASNFYHSPFTYHGITYPTNEHFFQAQKGYPDSYAEIAALTTPGKAKRAGRKLKLRPNWEQIKIEIMQTGLIQKFTQNPHLLKMLKSTGTATLIEGNTWHDNFWGNCTCDKCTYIPGQNMLGKLLMEIRTIL